MRRKWIVWVALGGLVVVASLVVAVLFYGVYGVSKTGTVSKLADVPFVGQEPYRDLNTMGPLYYAYYRNARGVSVLVSGKAKPAELSEFCARHHLDRGGNLSNDDTKRLMGWAKDMRADADKFDVSFASDDWCHSNAPRQNSEVKITVYYRATDGRFVMEVSKSVPE